MLVLLWSTQMFLISSGSVQLPLCLYLLVALGDLFTFSGAVNTLSVLHAAAGSGHAQRWARAWQCCPGIRSAPWLATLE